MSIMLSLKKIKLEENFKGKFTNNFIKYFFYVSFPLLAITDFFFFYPKTSLAVIVLSVLSIWLTRKGGSGTLILKSHKCFRNAS